jgi:hypothetical protein
LFGRLPRNRKVTFDDDDFVILGSPGMEEVVMIMMIVSMQRR